MKKKDNDFSKLSGKDSDAPEEIGWSTDEKEL